MPTSSLELAIAALGSGAPAEALERLLEAWRTTRSPELAARIEALAARFTVDALPDSKAWIERARRGRAEDRSGLIAALVRTAVAAQTTVNFGPDGSHTVSGPVDELASLLDEVAKWADDPRTAQLGLQVLSWPGDGVSWRKGFLRGFRCIDVAADPTTIAGLEARLEAEKRKEPWRPVESLRDDLIARAQNSLAKLRERFPEGVPALPEGTAPLLAAIDEAIAGLPTNITASAPPATTPESLWAAVYENPDDDRPRAVLADSLLERSDPRGEFIALQLAPSSDPKVLKRAATLLKKHARRWLGPLAAVVAAKSAVFERGFPVECVARATRREQAEIEFGLREWATVERLTFAMLPSMDPAIAVLTPAMKHVRSLAGVPVDALDRLALLEWPRLEHLGIRHRIWLMHEGRAQGLTALARAKLPALRSLSLLLGEGESSASHGDRSRTPADYEWLHQASWFEQLESVTLSVHAFRPEVIAAWLEEARRCRWQALTLTTDDGYAFGTWTLCFELQVRSGDFRVTLKVHPPLEAPTAAHLDILARCLAQLEPMPSVQRLIVRLECASPLSDEVRRRLGSAVTRWPVSFEEGSAAQVAPVNS